MALLPPQFLDGVVAIGREVAQGQIDWYGTGFLFGELTGFDPQSRMYDMTLWLVTCRHVFHDEPDMHVRLNLKSGEVRDVRVLVNNDGKQQWTPHPAEAVDIAVMGLDVALFRAAGVDDAYIFSENCWPLKTLRDRGVSEGDAVFVLGYPLGIMSRGRQRAVVRAGIIARVRDAYDQSPSDFLIDAHILEGNSGGPVVTRPEFVAIQGTSCNTTCAVIGIVTHVYTHNPRAKVLVEGGDGKVRLDEKFQVRLQDPAGLARVEPVDRIHETIAAHRARLGEGELPSQP